MRALLYAIAYALESITQFSEFVPSKIRGVGFRV
jgi:hypothetical protein